MKWKFWKKEEAPPEMPMPQDLGPPDMGMPQEMKPPGLEGLGMPESAPGIDQPPLAPMEPMPSAQPAFAQQQPAGMSTEQQLQLISSKLDTLKAQMDVVLQRLERMEHNKEQSPYQQRWSQGI